MQPEEILNLPVGSICRDNAVLLLWATSPKLPLAFEVMSAWGFTYKTVSFVWVKKNPVSGGNFVGMGFYTRQNAEFVLLGTRGRGLERQDFGVQQIVEAPVGRHSAKPEEVRNRIDRLFPNQDRIELFARTRVTGWDAWGFDAPTASDTTDES